MRQRRNRYIKMQLTFNAKKYPLAYSKLEGLGVYARNALVKRLVEDALCMQDESQHNLGCITHPTQVVERPKQAEPDRVESVLLGRLSNSFRGRGSESLL